MATLRRARGARRDKGGPPTSRKIEPGDLLLLDFSVIVSGYRGDFTNTFAVGGGPTTRPARAVRGLRRCAERGRSRAQARHGRHATSTRPSAAISRSLGLDQYFPTHSGHGLGLGHPEPPYFVPESTDTLAGRRRGRTRARFIRRGNGRHALSSGIT